LAPAESALIVPALELVPLVESFRLRYDPSASAGIPPHVTVMYPFLDPAHLTSEVLAELDRLLIALEAFTYSLVDMREFDGGVLYLAPEPAEPFIALTEHVRHAFDVAPHRGAYATVVPHLTVAQTATELERKRIAEVMKRSLPQAALAADVWLVVGSNETGWRKHRAISLSR
jgi:2'-5' RNA ligase